MFQVAQLPVGREVSNSLPEMGQNKSVCSSPLNLAKNKNVFKFESRNSDESNMSFHLPPFLYANIV